jgi:hypothetical protein
MTTTGENWVTLDTSSALREVRIFSARCLGVYEAGAAGMGVDITS